MGYRSDVAFAIRFPNAEQRNAFAVAIRMNGNALELECFAEYREYNDRTYTCFFSDVKWYDGYADVKAHHELMERAVDAHEGSYVFRRIGEEDDDIETQGNGEDAPWELVHLSRSLEIMEGY